MFSGSRHRTSRARPKAPWLRSVAVVWVAAGATEETCVLGIRVGSATARWSWSTMPAGTSTTHRRPNWWVARAARPAAGRPTMHAGIPAVRDPLATRRGPVTTPATATTQASGAITTTTGPGARSRNRRSSP